MGKSKAIVLREFGEPFVLRPEFIEVGGPAPDQILVRQTAAGLNYHDVHLRHGDYRPTVLPIVPGLEGAGRVEAIGSEVTEFRPGDRVVYVDASYGGYSELKLVPANLAVHLPDGISDEVAAAAFLKGTTAELLLHRAYAVRPGDTLLVHAAAGGVGMLLCQWGKHIGATVIGTAGSPDKMAFALAHGCDHAINYKDEDFVGRVRDITSGRGVQAVYDSVGGETFKGSLKCLARRGGLISFGRASGPIEPVEIMALLGSKFLTRQSLFDYMIDRETLLSMSHRLFDVLRTGAVRIRIHKTYPLSQAAEAHADLQGRATIGSLVLLP